MKLSDPVAQRVDQQLRLRQRDSRTPSKSFEATSIAAYSQAPILADYGIVDDFLEVMPALIEEFGGESPEP